MSMDPKKIAIIVIAVIVALVIYDKVIKKYVD
ncbi:hypothetical protein ES703_92178 [subsurface metagenome]